MKRRKVAKRRHDAAQPRDAKTEDVVSDPMVEIRKETTNNTMTQVRVYLNEYLTAHISKDA